jgi:tRNA(Ile)-lysidine synthase
MNLLQRVSEEIARQRLLAPGQPVLVAVSGGPDSLCLLHLLRQLEFPVMAAHLDHGLRVSSAAEAEAVARLARAWGVPLRSERVEVAKLAADEGVSLEEAARLARYRFLVRVAIEFGVDRLATGHTQDDQAETIVMHFLRGSGPDGLRGMQPSVALEDWVMVEAPVGLRLIRPLLGVSRAETSSYCRQHSLEPLEDPSNLDPTFTRNRVRHELMPALAGYNPAIKEVLARSGEVMRAVAEHLAAEVAAAWPHVIRPAGEGALALARESFLAQPLALQRRLARRAIEELKVGLRDVGFEHVERLISFVADPSPGRLDLVAGLVLEAAGGEVVLREPTAQARFPSVPQISAEVELPAEGRLPIDSGWAVEIQRSQVPQAQVTAALESLRREPGRWVEIFDEDAIRGKLRLRRRQTGDQLAPLGLEGTAKVADLFVDHKVPASQRRAWPILVDDIQVLWVLGLRRSKGAAVSLESRSIVRIEVVPGSQA